MALNIISEADRCLNCRNPLCKTGCPVSTRINEIIQMFRNNQIMEAGAILFENNPLSLVCAKVCNHEAQCTGHCVLNHKGVPVRFYEIEEYISDTYLDRMEVKIEEKKEQSAAIIGAGAAGITVAFKLAQAGYDVTIFDEKTEIGGMMRYGIPEFRLPNSILDRYKKKLLEYGVKIRPNTILGGALHIADLFRDGYNSVFIGTGTWRPKALGLVGETLANVHYGIAYLTHPDSYDLGENVAVIGMGNVAMDVARTALRHGAKKVTLYARSKRIAASEDEVEYTKLDGAAFVFGRAIEKITRQGPVFKVAVFDENDKVTAYEDELELVDADSTIIAISQGPKDALVNTTDGLKSDECGLLITDENGKTTLDGVYAAGDVVHGSMTVVHAVHDAKIAAEAMIRYMEEKRN